MHFNERTKNTMEFPLKITLGVSNFIDETLVIKDLFTHINEHFLILKDENTLFE